MLSIRYIQSTKVSKYFVKRNRYYWYNYTIVWTMFSCCNNSCFSECGSAAVNPQRVVFCRLPYRMIFAVATEDAVLVYDTQQPQPLAFFTNIHYHQLSDITWYVPTVSGHILLPYTGLDPFRVLKVQSKLGVGGWCVLS